MKKALITGINGQDGSYLAEFLLEKGYIVFGLVLRNTSLEPIDHLKNKITLIEGNLVDQTSLDNAVAISNPDEVYHLAALTFVGESWKNPILTADVNALGTVRLLESIRKKKPNAKFYHASTSEMFGLAEDIKTEESSFHPKSPYAVSKCFSHWISVNYRESYNMFICCGILFNHESPRRGKNFVTRKIAKSVVEIKNNQLDCLYLGNLDAKRDWGYAKEYVEAMWLMMQQDKPDDYIVSTGEVHSVRDFLEESFNVVGIKIESNKNNGINEEYINKSNNQVVVKISPNLFRPVELICLKGNNNKVKEKLNWQPKTKFKELVKLMVTFEEINCDYDKGEKFI